jgi:hypothetical protein
MAPTASRRFSLPYGLGVVCAVYPAFKRRATIRRPSGTLPPPPTGADTEVPTADTNPDRMPAG